MANVNYNKPADATETAFKDVSENYFFTADTFPAAGYDSTRQLYFKVSPTRVLNLEDEDITTVKGTDILTGLRGVDVEINIVD